MFINSKSDGIVDIFLIQNNRKKFWIGTLLFLASLILLDIVLYGKKIPSLRIHVDSCQINMHGQFMVYGKL